VIQTGRTKILGEGLELGEQLADLSSCDMKGKVDGILGILNNQSITAILACIDNNDWTMLCRLLEVREQGR